MSLSKENQQLLLTLARQSIEYGLATGKFLPIMLDAYPDELKPTRATFVTLNSEHKLRGCVGVLEARRPLAEDVVANAFAAAFNDPRFTAVKQQELPGLEIYISVLSPAEPMAIASEQDLLNQLRPGIDGLILKEGSKRATFLPTVWESLTEPTEFLACLKQKAGLSAHYWSGSMAFYRYSAEKITSQ